MRAIIIATGYKTALASLMPNHPTPLLCVADKPILFHVLDFLSALKITHYDLILSHLPHMIEKRVGDGKRWGIDITYHLVRDNDHTLAMARAMAANRQGELFWIASGDGLPDINPLAYKEPINQPLLWMYPHYHWSGWGILSSAILLKTTPAITIKELPLHLAGVKSVFTVPLIQCESLFELKNSNMKFIKCKHPSVYFPAKARLVSPGLWIAQGASIHPTAKLIAPVYIGANCQIGKDCQIGPQVVIERYSMIDKGSELSRSLIMRNSYVGENLQVHDCIIDRNLLINLSIKTEVTFRDDFILSELSPPSLGQFPLKIFERTTALCLFIFCLPIYLYLKIRYKEIENKVLALPAKAQESEWKQCDLYSFEEPTPSKGLIYYFHRLPLLINIVRGEAHFVGLAPRTIEKAKELPEEWKRLYLNSKIGLITLADLDGATSPNIDAAEMYYAVQRSFWFDLKLIFRWLRTRLKSSKRQSDAK